MAAARDWRTESAAGGCRAEKQGAPFFMIPALCQAMESIVLPSMAVWSMPRLVIPVTVGETSMLVLSY